MSHPLVDQLRFTRREWLRDLEGVSEADGAQHLAWHEQRYWLERSQGKILFPVLNELFAYGAPMNTPSLQEMLGIWHQVTQAADPCLDTLTTERFQEELLVNGKAVGQTVGSAMRRITSYYWYHIGEIQAIRQMLGHANLPEYVGDIEIEAPYRPE